VPITQILRLASSTNQALHDLLSIESARVWLSNDQVLGE